MNRRNIFTLLIVAIFSGISLFFGFNYIKATESLKKEMQQLEKIEKKVDKLQENIKKLEDENEKLNSENEKYKGNTNTQEAINKSPELSIPAEGDLIAEIAADGDNGKGGMYFGITITNISNKLLKISTNNLTLINTSKISGSETNLPLYESDLELGPSESTTFSQIFGTFSGDMPQYQSINVLYNDYSIFYQDPLIESYK
ncbi:hypothetical protein ACWN8V_07700 [Vagococcus elongatus]|uniref:Uncharacterized protein n=1 Tax=Vagococcus elongatus TaxID=180344 RepID=A0A430AU22_9ENTE|nr:hypothetical protein [Vagococcus elongatus]RSU11558.1 hypothetical protein CBF29_07710 [Vagococcus elongatus]